MKQTYGSLRRIFSTLLFFLLLICGTGVHGQNDTLSKGIATLSRIGCTIVDSSIRITGTGAIHSNKASFPGETTLDEIDHNFFIKINSLDTAGDVHFVIGKHGGIAGTMLEFIATDTTSIIKVDRLNSLSPVFITQFVLPFVLEAGASYHVRVGKRVRALVIEVISADSSEVFYNDSLSYPTPFFGCLWGKPFVAAHAGTISVRDFSLTTPLSKTPRLMVWGDSFIEGNALAVPEDRYIELVQDSIGHQNVTISGKGGESSGTMSVRFKTELEWFKGSKYAYLPIGVNDLSFTVWKNNMMVYIDSVKKNGMIPIIATLSPRSDRLPFIAAVNSWIRDDYNGAYIDVNKAISPSGTTWGTGLGMTDSVHPTPAGHYEIYERMQLEAPYLFRTSDPYSIDYFTEKTVEPISGFLEYDYFTDFAAATTGSLTAATVIPGQTLYFRDTLEIPGVNSLYDILPAPKRPATPGIAPVGGSGFDWINNPAFPNVNDYEYSDDGGVLWTTCTSKPVYAGVGSIQLRIKATPVSFRSDPLTIVDILTGIASSFDATLPDLLVYPNPVSDHLTIGNVFEPTSVSVYSADGRLIKSLVLENEMNEISTLDLSQGFFIFNIKNSRGEKNIKILKK